MAELTRGIPESTRNPRTQLERAQATVAQLEAELAELDTAIPPLQARVDELAELRDAAEQVAQEALAALPRPPRRQWNAKGEEITVVRAPVRDTPELRAKQRHFDDVHQAFLFAREDLRVAEGRLRTAWGRRSAARAQLGYQKQLAENARQKLDAQAATPSRESRARALLGGLADSLGIGGTA